VPQTRKSKPYYTPDFSDAYITSLSGPELLAFIKETLGYYRTLAQKAHLSPRERDELRDSREFLLILKEARTEVASATGVQKSEFASEADSILKKTASVLDRMTVEELLNLI
jgi:multidrug resistance efflux pump